MRVLIAMLLVAAPALAQERAFPVPYCTDRNGERVELGGLICIAAGCVPPYLARCEMSLNSPMWRKVQEGCPAVSVEPPATTPLRSYSEALRPPDPGGSRGSGRRVVGPEVSTMDTSSKVLFLNE